VPLADHEAHEVKKKSTPQPSESPLFDEIEAVLRNNQDATDFEIREAVNRWWSTVRTDESEATDSDVQRIRSTLGISQTSRRPHQKKLFE
jgi:hypothetical protein